MARRRSFRGSRRSSSRGSRSGFSRSRSSGRSRRSARSSRAPARQTVRIELVHQREQPLTLDHVGRNKVIADRAGQMAEKTKRSMF